VRKEHPKLKALEQAEPMLVVGLPVARILEVAKKIEPSMVVMGSQGRTGLKHVLIGSKAEQVVRLCPVPVCIVKTRSAKE
jgi:nucleotide-binding universal stress UspA family protein